MKYKHILSIDLSTLRFCLVSFAVLLILVEVKAQDAEVRRVRTFPGIENPAFPYAEPEEVGISSDKLAQLGDEVHRWAANGDFVGGELLIIKDGKTVLHEAYGWADREARLPAERNSIWSIKSMSKPFTTTATMMLVEEGKLSLEDKLIDFIPEYKGDPRTTIGHLLSHTSGYKKYDYHDPDPSHKSLKDWVMGWARTEPTGTFGQYDYTDFGFAACGYLVELITGMSIEKFTRTRIIEPMGLQNTSTGFSDDPHWRDRLNAWYRWDADLGRYNLLWNTSRGPWQIYPAAWGMFSTAMDYAEFLSMFMNRGFWNGRRILEEESATNMLLPHGFRKKSPMYGYGWFLMPGKDDPYPPLRFGHSGGDGTMGYAFPQENLLVIFMTHSRDGGHRTALLDRINLLGISHTPPGRGMVPAIEFSKPVEKLSESGMDQYTGSYMGRVPGESENVLLTVEKHANLLQIRLNSFGQETGFVRHLVYLGKDRFAPAMIENGKLAWANPDVVMQFERANNAIASIEIIVNGEQNISGKRTDAEEVHEALLDMRSRKAVSDLVDERMQTKDVHAARTLSRELHHSRPDHVVFREDMLNTLGYRYLNRNAYDQAIAIFEMNVEAYPDCANCYDSLADAWQRRGDLKKALKFYQKAVELARKQGDLWLDAMEAKLERVKGMLGQEQGTNQ